MRSALSARSDGLMLANGLVVTRIVKTVCTFCCQCFVLHDLDWRLSGKNMAIIHLWPEGQFCQKCPAVVEELTVDQDA